MVNPDFLNPEKTPGAPPSPLRINPAPPGCRLFALSSDNLGTISLGSLCPALLNPGRKVFRLNLYNDIVPGELWRAPGTLTRTAVANCRILNFSGFALILWGCFRGYICTPPLHPCYSYANRVFLNDCPK